MAFFGRFLRKKPDSETLLRELVEINKGLEGGEFLRLFNLERALRDSRQIRATISPFVGNDADVEKILSVGAAAEMELLRASAAKDYADMDRDYPGRAVQSNILAGYKLAEDILAMEGDVFSAVVSPIELGMDSEVWVTCRGDKGLATEINDRLRAWRVIDTINSAWQDMETYSCFYLSHTWKDPERPQPLHWSPKRIAVGPFDDGLGFHTFNWLPEPRESKEIAEGDEKQLAIEFFNTDTSTDWNDWQQGGKGFPLKDSHLTWNHFLKPRHHIYPRSWLAKAATPVYTRQIIEEMRLALVQGVMSQLWVMTIDDPVTGEVKLLKSVMAANRAERMGFLIWRGGLNVNSYTPAAIQELLLPDLWWNSTLDIFRRIGRTIRIVSGESGTSKGTGGKDAEIDVQIAQRKAMAHRNSAAQVVVSDLIRQWGEFGSGKNKKVVDLVDSGKIRIHLSPIELFLGQILQDLWGPMWDRGMASVHTIHSAMGLDTDTETALLEEEEKDGYPDIYLARQQFAQRVATPGGDVTRSSEPGRPPGPSVQAAVEITQQLQDAFDQIDEAEEQEERKRRVTAFIALLTALIRIHMRSAYEQGYASVPGERGIDVGQLGAAQEWEQDFINGFESALLDHVEVGNKVGPSEGYRVPLHVSASYRRAYMSGVFQGKAEQGWTMWKRVLRPNASKSGPCETCTTDARIWHPITEPFWDHPYGVCSVQIVRFMRSSTDGWQSEDRRQVLVPTE